jgi:osmotically-inducible protein OsmY
MSASDAEHEAADTPQQPPTRASVEYDDQLRELIRQRLTEDPALDASDIRIEVRTGRVILVGTVADAGASSEIEQTVENCGALEIDNQLRPLMT